MKSLLYICMMSFALLCACGAPVPEMAEEETADSPRPVDVSGVKTLLPQAGHVALVESYCMPCHSLRYIETQPELSYHDWEKTVDKMINTYGAPVRDSQTRRDIINYLHAIKGRKE